MPPRRRARGLKKAIKKTPGKTMKILGCLQDLLRCVICGTIPDKVYVTSKCDHKYCRTCVTKVEGKICLVCDVKVEKTDFKLDEFSSV